jgi:hypothetical protein
VHISQFHITCKNEWIGLYPKKPHKTQNPKQFENLDLCTCIAPWFASSKP